MRTVINFGYYGMEIALFVLMVFSCSYLCLLSSVDTNAKYLTISKKYRKDKAECIDGGNNSSSSHLLKSNYDYCAGIDHGESLPFVSIIVPARNEEDYIERCLFSLLRQDYPNFEIIAIDDNSSDNTLAIMENIKNRNNSKTIGLPVNKLKILSLKFKPDEWTGKTWASEKGYLQSKGTLLLFVDADTNYVNRHLIRKAVSYMQKENLDVLTGIPSSEKLKTKQILVKNYYACMGFRQYFV
jgi:cellulose synthase/poly-beta-1,6-N-acetylglucosamine synthase-like glycosyltransferase